MYLKQFSALCCTVLCLTGPTKALAAQETAGHAAPDTVSPASLSTSVILDTSAAADPFPSWAASSQSASSDSSAAFDSSDSSDFVDLSASSDESEPSDATLTAESSPAYDQPNTIVVSSHKVQINGIPAVPQAYTIDRYNYFKLRDIAYLLNETTVSFDLNWDNDTRTIDIIPHTAYTTVGGEMAVSPGSSLKTFPSTATVTMNGEKVAIKGYSINGNNYYKIADLAKTVGFQALFDNDTRTVHIVTPEDDAGTSSTVVPTTDPSETIADPNVSVDGEKPNGEKPDGEKPDGEKSDGEKPDEEKFDGEKPNDEPSNGTTPDKSDENTGTDEPTDLNPIGSNQPTNPTDPETPSDKDPDSDSDANTNPEHKPAIDPELGDPDDSSSTPDSDTTTPDEDKKEDKDDESDNQPDEPDEEPKVPTRVSHLDGVRTVIIDPGHGGGDLGASHPTLDLDEKHVNLYVAQYLKAYLEAAGVNVIMVRSTLEEGAELSLRGSVMQENLETVDLFFGLHHNAANTEARGAQVLAQIADEEREDGPSRILAEELNKEYENIGLTVRPIWFRHGDHGDYYYTNRKAAELQIVAVISEFCFIDNDEDVLFIDSKIDWQTEAKGLSRAILRYFEQVEY